MDVSPSIASLFTKSLTNEFTEIGIHFAKVVSGLDVCLMFAIRQSSSTCAKESLRTYWTRDVLELVRFFLVVLVFFFHHTDPSFNTIVEIISFGCTIII